jgi:hypothetical protein
MDDTEIKLLYSWAWEHWGPDAQIDLLINEMAELTKSLIKSKRADLEFSPRVIEKLVDVQICLEQLKNRINTFGFERDLEKIRDLKLQFLKDRLMRDVGKNIEGLADLPWGNLNSSKDSENEIPRQSQDQEQERKHRRSCGNLVGDDIYGSATKTWF